MEIVYHLTYRPIGQSNKLWLILEKCLEYDDLPSYFFINPHNVRWKNYNINKHIYYVFVGGIRLNCDMKENLMLFNRFLTDVVFISFSMYLPSFKFMRAWFLYGTIWTPNFIDHIFIPIWFVRVCLLCMYPSNRFRSRCAVYVYFILPK